MENNREKPALLIIDMVKDNFEEEKHLPITAFAKKLIEPINALSATFRKQGWPVIFSTDALCNNFKAVLLEDCCAAFSMAIHEQTLNLYQEKSPVPVVQSIDFKRDVG